MSAGISREDALALLHEWVGSEALRRHCLAVEAAMREAARREGEDVEDWGVAGLLHDLDYERHPDLETGHPRVALRELERLGVSADVREAIAGHAPYLGVPRETRMARWLFAVDELSGFVVACALVRPRRLDGLKASSVRKKLRTPAFAAAVNREDIVQGAVELGREQAELIELVIAGLQAEAEALALPAGT